MKLTDGMRAAIRNGRSATWIADQYELSPISVIRAAEADGFRFNPDSDTFTLLKVSAAARLTPPDELIAAAEHLAPFSPAIRDQLQLTLAALVDLRQVLDAERASAEWLHKAQADTTVRPAHSTTPRTSIPTPAAGPSRARFAHERKAAKPKPAPKKRAKAEPLKPLGGPPPSVVRAWAKEQGLDVNRRGHVHRHVRQAYLDAHGGAA